jgi:hypothetical protein
LEEVLEFFIGEHFINQFEDRLLIVLIELLDQPHLFDSRFIFNPLAGARLQRAAAANGNRNLSWRAFATRCRF